MYPKIKANDNRAYFYDGFKKGIGKAENGETTLCRNFYRCDEKLITRPTLSKENTAILFDGGECELVNFELTDSVLFGDGEYVRMAVAECTDDDTYKKYEFTLLGSGGRRKEAGSIEFRRVSSELFIAPSSYTVFSAAPSSNGGGVYVIFGGYNESKAVMGIYELSKDGCEWLKINENETYMPDYYVNGRGDAYSYSDVTLPAPQYKEAINMLNPAFNCYFTSDGESNAFRLPMNRLVLGDGDRVDVALSLSNEETVNWRITKNNIQDTAQIGEYEVTLSLEEGTGMLRFVSNPEGYVIPYVYGDTNNIKATVTVNNDENRAKISGMTQSIWYASGASGARLCLAGNRNYPALVCISHPNNPLYFPDNNQFTVGDPSQRVTALGRQNKSVVIFKEREIYSAYYSAGNFLVTNIHSTIGCDQPSTVATCDNRLIWTNSKGDVYILATLSQYSVTGVYRISTVIPTGEVAAADYCNACAFKDRYMLFVKNRVYVMDYADVTRRNTADFANAVRWFVWELPEDVTVAAVFAGEERMTAVCTNGTRGSGIYYISDFEENGTEDGYIPRGEDGYVSDKVEGLIEMRLNDGFGDHVLKAYTDLYLRLYSENDLLVDFIDEKCDTVKTSVINIEYNAQETCRAYRMLPLIKGSGISVKLRTHGKAALDGVVYFCRALANRK